MAYYKGTEAQCEAYNTEVVQGENYTGGTTRWAAVHHIEGECYILKAEPPMATMTYTSELIEVEQLPIAN